MKSGKRLYVSYMLHKGGKMNIPKAKKLQSARWIFAFCCIVVAVLCCSCLGTYELGRDEVVVNGIDDAKRIPGNEWAAKYFVDSGLPY